MRPSRRFVVSTRFREWAFAIFITLALVEMGLRAQQWLGPLYDLEHRPHVGTWYSELVNHRPPLHWSFTLPSPIFGEHAGLTITQEYDEAGIRVPHSIGSAPNCTQVGTILFIGDSFIEGYDIHNTVPDHVARFLATKYGLCARILNAGHSSYSPAIFIPLARILLPDISPDYVVVDVDETDLTDDVARYERLIVRNEKGENVGVRASPQLKEMTARSEGAGTHWLYLHRLLDRLYIRFVLMPRIAANAPATFAYSGDLSPEAEHRYATELAILRRNLIELVGVLAKGTGSTDRIVFIRHPHIHHLETPTRPALWSNLIGSTVGQTVTKLGASYFDATSELSKRFGDDPTRFYWNGDMHLNFRGLELYAEVVAAFLAKKIRSDLGVPK